MKRLVVLFWCAVSLPFAEALPHMDMEMTGEEYTVLLRRFPQKTSNRALNDIINIGKRSLDWLRFINSNRPPGQTISFSSADTQVGYPIDTPDYNNATIVQGLYDKFVQEAPAWFADVVIKGGTFPTNPAVSDAEYIQWGLRLDRIYQKASRWLLMSPNLSSYAALRKNDVRGYYHLNQYADVKATLDSFYSLQPSEQQNISEWLAGMCANGGGSLSSCRGEIKNVIAQKKSLYPAYQKYLPIGQKLWTSYFR